MLKRFMNWLLNKWQGLFSALGGKRSPSSPSSGPIDQSDLAIPVAARTPFTPSTASLIKSVVEPAAPVTNRPAVLPKIIKSDTHQRIDATSAALTDPVRPVFPTEVSALMGAPLQPGEGSDLPFRTLKKIPDSQLPAIHDLLPATEAVESDNPLESPSSSHPAFAENDLVDNDLIENDLIENDLSEETIPETTTSNQVVLFSFDIVESDIESDVESDIAEDSDWLESDDVLAESLSVDADVDIDIETANSDREGDRFDDEPMGIDQALTNQDFEISIEPASVEPASVEPVDALSEPAMLTKAEILPYPWSLPVSNLGPPVEKTDEAHALKNGIVKLLFTLKEGNFHGYIAPDDGTQDILFHQKYINADIFSQLDRGIKVAVSVKYIEGKAYATHINLL